MANLGLFEIETNGKYEKLEDIIDLPLTQGVVYQIQVITADGMLQYCEKAVTPDEAEGFVQKGRGGVIEVEIGSADFWVKNLTGNLKVNIAEE